MTLLTRDQILTSNDLPFEDVECPEWGGTVRVSTIAATLRDEYEVALARLRHEKSKSPNIRARLVALCITDENGARLFSDDDVIKLGLKSSKALDRVFDVASRLNGLTPEQAKELEGNFDDAQSERSTSD
ncbi:hypothetical protein [Nocardioides alkalitolerans]|uniref:hypothetical protein n=1 Tax=Nocardioides alkalitolerans TaxID=281714 RepID=UPI000491B4A2|nr:hypothetical protein [Nocardioides alkalitolerans]